MPIQAKIIADSISNEDIRLTTFELIYPRFIHAEFMTHRVFSRNASSSRAIPVARMIQMVKETPAMPIHWGANQAGMQAKEELPEEAKQLAKRLWLQAATDAANTAEHMCRIGLHKQVANRILEPFQHISVVMTTTELSNWFDLRAHPDAQPEIAELAYQMAGVLSTSHPILLQPGEWHLPYVSMVEQTNIGDLNICRKVSAARCCRVSYLKHDGTSAAIEEDLLLCDRLAGSVPIHASPFEHQATPDALHTIQHHKDGFYAWDNFHLHGNFRGWIQNRKLIEQSFK